MKKINPSQIKKGGRYAIVSSFGVLDKVFTATGDINDALNTVPSILYYDENGQHATPLGMLTIHECVSVYQLTEREYKTVDTMFLNYNKKFFDFIQKSKIGK